MGIQDIPITVVGPGSQPPDADGEALSYMRMPSDMAKYVRPHIPEPEDVFHLTGARSTMGWLRRQLDNQVAGEPPEIANIAGLDDESSDLVNQILGEGEVSITFGSANRARSQEAVLAGVWRSLYFDESGTMLADLLEVGDVPHLVRLPNENAKAIDTSNDDVPADVMNAMPILVELESHLERYAKDDTPNVINLTLLPLSDADVEFLDARLGRGPVDILSRAYGKCQVVSTNTPNVWWVRYYNSMNTLILNTLEVIDIPQVVCAAPEDLADSRSRLDQILAPYWPDVA